jgi:hypothetical protein
MERGGEEPEVGFSSTMPALLIRTSRWGKLLETVSKAAEMLVSELRSRARGKSERVEVWVEVLVLVLAEMRVEMAV